MTKIIDIFIEMPSLIWICFWDLSYHLTPEDQILYLTTSLVHHEKEPILHKLRNWYKNKA